MIEQENIVRYWHAVELLQPQSAPKIKKRTNPSQAFFHDTPSTWPTPPWAPGSVVEKQPLPEKRVWSHTLYAHLYDGRLVADALKHLYGADQGYREPQHRDSALFSAKFNMAGQLVENSFVLSSEAWFLGRALARRDWTCGFADDQRTAAEQAHTRLQGQVSGDALRDFTRWVLQFLGVADVFNADRLRLYDSAPNPSKPASQLLRMIRSTVSCSKTLALLQIASVRAPRAKRSTSICATVIRSHACTSTQTMPLNS